MYMCECNFFKLISQNNHLDRVPRDLFPKTCCYTSSIQSNNCMFFVDIILENYTYQCLSRLHLHQLHRYFSASFVRS